MPTQNQKNPCAATMPQKPLLKAGKKIEKKKEAANRHGKVPLTKKGN